MGKPSPYESLPLLEFTHGRSLCGATYSCACSLYRPPMMFKCVQMLSGTEDVEKI